MRKIIAVLLLSAMSSCLFAGYFLNLEDHLKGYKKQYFIYVNKNLKRLYLIDKNLKVWKTYIVATGAGRGDKVYDGDNRTPAGVYKILEICQYHEPWYMKQIREDMANSGNDMARFNFYRYYYRNARIKNIKGKKRIESLNSAYFNAAEGHTKYGTQEDLGYNAYGSVFMLLDYPNDEDIRKYRAAIAAGRVPVKLNGNYMDPGSGIAIHGTNDDPSIGNDSSSGCVRMQNADIVEVSNYVSEGTMVVID
jgi:murein L,D-transpeptidase YafK